MVFYRTEPLQDRGNDPRDHADTLLTTSEESTQTESLHCVDHGLSRKLERPCDQMVSMERKNTTRDQRMEELVEENTLLCHKVADLITKLYENTWARFTQPKAAIDNNVQ